MRGADTNVTVSTSKYVWASKRFYFDTKVTKYRSIKIIVAPKTMDFSGRRTIIRCATLREDSLKPYALFEHPPELSKPTIGRRLYSASIDTIPHTLRPTIIPRESPRISDACIKGESHIGVCNTKRRRPEGLGFGLGETRLAWIHRASVSRSRNYEIGTNLLRPMTSPEYSMLQTRPRFHVSRT